LHVPLTTVNTRLARCSLVSFLLAACSNGDDPPPPAPVAPPVQITPDNARDVARLAVAAAFGLSDVARIEADLVAPGLDPLGVQLSASLLPVLVTATRPGPEGGEVIQTWDDVDADMEVSTGDTFLHTFAAYGRFGLVLTGGMTVDEMDVSGEPLAGSVWTVRGRMGFLNLAVTTGGTTQVLNGSLRFVRERRPTVTILSLELDQGFEVGGTSLQPGNTIGYNEYPFSFEFARFAKGAALSDIIEGLVEFDAVVPFSGLVFLPAPWGGRMEVYGADGALIAVRIPDFGTTVIIEVDFDGDGVIDETVTTTWPTL
jgi:hypothetical protein